MEQQTKKRIEWVDAAKGIGILMVAFGHNWLDSDYSYLFTAFHMPLFFLMAGYTFSDKREPVNFIINKVKTLLIPYLLFVACNLIFYELLSKTHDGNYDLQGEAIAFLWQKRHTYLWFLPVLFFSEILVYILSRFRCIKNIQRCCIVLFF